MLAEDQQLSVTEPLAQLLTSNGYLDGKRSTQDMINSAYHRPGAIVLARALRDGGATRNLAILYTGENVSKEAVQALEVSAPEGATDRVDLSLHTYRASTTMSSKSSRSATRI